MGDVRNLKVTNVSFITSKEATARLAGEATGLPDAALVCLVDIQGDIRFGGPSGSTLRYSRGYEMFNAKTGNLLMAGGLPGRDQSGK